MELLFNERSIHAQFICINAFREAIERVMRLRSLARQYGRELHCHSSLVEAQALATMNVRQAVQRMPQAIRTAILQWTNKQGPFWNAHQLHDLADSLVCKGENVAGTAVGEAASQCYCGGDHRLVSASPSDWEYSPVEVVLGPDSIAPVQMNLSNYWEPEDLTEALVSAEEPITTWQQLADASRRRYGRLVIADTAFEPLHGHPFARAASNQILELLAILQNLQDSHDADGNRTDKGNRLYQMHFVGDEALFSDSSATEKREFEQKLTFKDPANVGATLFCPWHGKVAHRYMRLHFGWPKAAGEAFVVVYVGPKLTKR